MNYLFSANELMTMLALTGAKKAFIFDISEQEIKEEELIRCLYRLYSRNLLIQQDDAFILSAEINEIIKCISKVKRVLRVDYPNNNIASRLIYRLNASEIIVLEHLFTDLEDIYRLSTMNIQEFTESLLTDELYELYPSIRTFLKGDEVNQNRLTMDTMIEDSSICLSISLIMCKKEEIIEQLSVNQRGLLYETELRGRRNETRAFNEEYFKEQIFKELERCN